MTSPDLVCPTCGDELAVSSPDSHLVCPSGHEFPVVCGVTDLRGALAGFDTERDLAIAAELHHTPGDLEELLRRYWSRQSDVSPEAVERFVRGDLVGAERGRDVAVQIETLSGRSFSAGDVVVEIGAGSGALSAALSPCVAEVWVTDVSLAWLVLARQRFAEAGLHNAHFIAAAADRLPMRDGSIHWLVGADVIEHVPDAEALARNGYRVLAPGGVMWLSTPNRLSPTPEPHVKLWGVGYLPRRFADGYVRRRRGIDYSDVNLLTARRLRRLLRGATGGPVHVVAPEITEPVRDGYPPLARRVIGAYNRVARSGPGAGALRMIAPLLHATVSRPTEGPHP